MPRPVDPHRREAVLEKAADYVLEQGLADLSLRPLAKALGTSTRMLLYDFGSKERLIHEILAEIRARLKHKKATQPLALAAAGCVWKNPDYDHAARLLEKTGLRGKRVGGAEISAKHANFILNRGGATAQDVLNLLELAFERVYKQAGIRLTTELRIMGE